MENTLRNSGFAALLTASRLAAPVLVYADSVAYVPSAKTLGLLPPPSLGFSFRVFLLFFVSIAASLIQKPLLRRKDRNFTDDFSDLPHRTLNICNRFDIFTQDPKNPTENLARFDFREGGDELSGRLWHEDGGISQRLRC